MVTIYDLANLILDDIISVFYDQDKDFDDVINSLNGKSDVFDNIFDSYKQYDFDKNTIKKVVMLNIFSLAYLINLYKVKIDLDSENCERFLAYLESLNAQEIIDMFKCSSPEIKVYFEDASEYINNSYIQKYCCWENLFAEKKEQVLLKINPFAVLENKDIELGDGFVETEVYIQLFNDLYDKALEEASLDPELSDEDDVEEFDRLVVEYFWKLVDTHFSNDESKIKSFYSALLSNVYENIMLNVKKNVRQRKKYHSLIDKFDEYSLDDLIAKFRENHKFVIDIIDIFITYNEYLEKEELIKRRIDFLKSGNVQRLAELNPFFEQDNKVLKRRKEKGSI